MTFGKVLHLGNILNNGYLNCKFLRRAGFEADSITIDYHHVQAQPEWEEVAISSNELDHFNPDWSSVDLQGFKRPGWFFDINLTDIDSLVPANKNESENVSTEAASLLASVKKDRSKHFLRRFSILLKVLRKLGLTRLWRKVEDSKTQSLSLKAVTNSENNEHFENLINEYKAIYPDRKPLTMEDIAEWFPRSLAQKELFDRYPLVQAYSLDPIYIMLACPDKPFIAFEHGTMRDFPFEDSARGRLYALAVQKAEKLIITNADCNRSAERLGLKNYTFIPHPVDESLYTASQNGSLREQLLSENNADWIFVAPARHHWKNCPAGMEGSWLKKNNLIIEAFAKLTTLRPEIRYVLVFFEWGAEVEESKKLIEELGIADHVVWRPISSKPIIKEYYQNCHFVLDQFNDGIGTFGTVVPEALASGKPVLINFKKELHEWCFDSPPPLINCKTAEDIFKNIESLIDDNDTYQELCTTSRKWFLENHSSQRVVKKHLDIYQEISNKYSWGWN